MYIQTRYNNIYEYVTGYDQETYVFIKIMKIPYAICERRIKKVPKNVEVKIKKYNNGTMMMKMRKKKISTYRINVEADVICVIKDGRTEDIEYITVNV